MSNATPVSVYEAPIAGSGIATRFTVSASKQMELLKATLSSSGTQGVSAILVKLADLTSQITLGTLTTGGTVYADASTTIHANGAVPIFTTTNDDGFLLQAAERFNYFALNVATGSVSATLVVEYWNGSAFVGLTTIAEPSVYATGANYTVFHSPPDWATGNGGFAGANSEMYSIRVTASTAHAAGMNANDLVVGKFLAYDNVMADGDNLSFNAGDLGGDEVFLLSGGQAIMAYTGGSGTGSLLVFYKSRG